MLKAEAIVYPKGGGVLSGISMSVDKGEAVCILGDNGSGKTLLLEILSTLRRPFAGVLTIMGKDAIKKPDNVRRYIGYASDGSHFIEGFTVEGYLAVFGGCYGLKGARNNIRREEVIRIMGLEDFKNLPMVRLSQSVLKRVSFARSLIHQPGVLIIDNPFMGIDDKWTARLSEILISLRKEGTTIICSTPSLAPIEGARSLWNRVEKLENGVLKPYE